MDIKKVKKLTLIALVSNDELMEEIVLKGGNAISIGYELGVRGSFDLDFSLEEDFTSDITIVSDTIKENLERVFSENGFVVFDFKFSQKPKTISDELVDFWGGYAAEFKIISQIKWDEFNGNLDDIRRNALSLNPDNSPKFQIEFSKHEFISTKKGIKIDGYTVYIYPPELLVFEKLRAICQQTPEYREIVKSHPASGRARDFYDIYTICENFDIDVNSLQSKEIIKSVFEAKRVPITLIRKIRDYKDLHAQDFSQVLATVSPSERETMNTFDFYFDYVLSLFEDMF